VITASAAVNDHICRQVERELTALLDRLMAGETVEERAAHTVTRGEWEIQHDRYDGYVVRQPATFDGHDVEGTWTLDELGVRVDGDALTFV
jgi:hypothetical protein